MPPTSASPISPKGKGLSVASLVLGILSVFPFSFLAGIPAIVTGTIALAQKRLGRGMAIAGIVLGAFGTIAVTAGILLALIIPNFVRFQERARHSSVEDRMHTFQTALEAYAADHSGNYPTGDEFELHFKGDRLFPDGMPVNPYTGERYRSGKDLFYRPGALPESGLSAVTDRHDRDCPFAGLAAPGGMPGTIVILGWTPLDLSDGRPSEYAIAGYGRDTDEPVARHLGGTFSVLHNRGGSNGIWRR